MLSLRLALCVIADFKGLETDTAEKPITCLSRFAAYGAKRRLNRTYIVLYPCSPMPSFIVMYN